MSVPMRWEVEAVPENPVICVKSRRAPRRKNRLRAMVVVSLAALLSAGVGVAAQKTFQALRPAPELRLDNSGGGSQIALNGASVERRLGFVTITGSVTNRRVTSLPPVEAVVELLDAQQHPVQMEYALVGSRALAAQSDAPFQIILPDNARAMSYRVRFRELAGADLN